MKVTISNTHVDEKKWTKGDRSGVIRTQLAMFETRKFRREGRLDLGKNLPAFAVGEYTVDAEELLDIGDFGDLKVARRFELTPTAAKPVRAA